MTRIIIFGGTGYAGAAIVAEAAARGHRVASFSRSLPVEQLDGVRYVQGDVSRETDIEAAINDAEVVIGALAPRGALENTLRDVYRNIGRLADAAGAPLYIVGGFSSLRPAPGAARFVSDLSHAPADRINELTTVSALVTDDLPATPETLNWVFISPAFKFGAHAPGERIGTYRVGDDVVVNPDGGGAISGPDYALGFVELIDAGTHHRAHVNLGY